MAEVEKRLSEISTTSSGSGLELQHPIRVYGLALCSLRDEFKMWHGDSAAIIGPESKSLLLRAVLSLWRSAEMSPGRVVLALNQK